MQPTPELSPDHSDAAETRPIVVLGAGVIGLTTAVRLLESASVRRRGIPVHILADHLPNDPLDAKYASTIAGAHHLSFADDDDLRQRTWDRTTFCVMYDEWRREGEKTGLMVLKQTEFYVGEDKHLKIFEEHPDFVVNDIPSMGLSFPADHSVAFTSLTMTPLTYLNRLVARISTLGGHIHRHHLPSLSHLDHVSATALIGSAAPLAVVVCAGIGALTLGGVEDSTVYPTRGQVVKVRAPWVRSGWTRQIGSLNGGEGGERTYVIPRPDGEVILGGTREEGDWNPYPRKETAEDILRRAAEICPILTPSHLSAAPLDDDLPTLDNLRMGDTGDTAAGTRSPLEELVVAMEYDPAEMAQLPHLSATSEHYFNTTSAAAYQPTHPLPAGHGATSFLGPAHAPSTSGSGAVSTSTRLDGVPPYSLSINHGNDNDDSNGTGTGPSHNHITVNGNGNGHGKGNGKGNSKGSSKADRTGSSTGAIGVARPPRSRKNRPCDRCRKSKSRCAIGASGPPCSQCSETRKDCTFELAPPVRKPRLQSTAEDGSSLGLGLGSDDVGGLLMGGRDSDTPTRSPSISTPATTAPRKRSRPGQRPRLSSARSRSRSSSVSSGGSESSGDAGGGSLVESGSGRARATARARMSDSVSVSTPQERPSRAGARNGNASGAGAGPSKKAKTKDRRDTNLSGLDVLAAAVPSFDHLANSEYDPHVLTVVLTDDLLPISDPREDGEKSHVKQISSDPARPIFVVMNPKTDTSQQPMPGAVSLAHLRTFLRHHPSHLPESHLISLYHTHVHPALPILPNNPTASQPPQLLATVLVTSLSHSKDTRSLAAPAAGLLSLGMPGLEENNLSGVASAVLELGIRPINSSRASYLLLAKTVALAQLLGMHMNPLQWAIPRWEQHLRIRLWWILAMHDAWMSFLNSRPCLMQAHNNSVPLPSLSSVLEASCAHSSASSDSAKAFITSCRLANLVRRLQRDVCTLGAVADRSTRERRDEVVELARRADELFGEWKGSASEGSARPTGVVSLLVHLLGFRCMLKRILIELDHGLGAMFTPDAEVLAPFNDCVGFIAQLSETELDGYFLNYASHIISSVTSSLIRLSLASPSSSTNSAMDLLSRLVRALHGFQTTSEWDIASPALRRAAAVENKLKSLGEHDQLLRALRGGITQSPLDVMAAVEAIATTAVAEASEMEPQFVWDWSGMDWDFGSLLGGTNMT